MNYANNDDKTRVRIIAASPNAEVIHDVGHFMSDEQHADFTDRLARYAVLLVIIFIHQISENR